MECDAVLGDGHVGRFGMPTACLLTRLRNPPLLLARYRNIENVLCLAGLDLLEKLGSIPCSSVSHERSAHSDNPRVIDIAIPYAVHDVYT